MVALVAAIHVFAVTEKLESRPALARFALSLKAICRSLRSDRLGTSSFALLAILVFPFSAVAQTDDLSFSEAVVQPLPSAEVTGLNSALQRLARNSRDVDALIDAGNASIKVSDIDAAIGFFGRAEELSPGNSRVKLGLAAAYVRKQRPLDALQLFDEAERAGASARLLAGERGLAYDLVGDNTSAQFHYQQAIAMAEDNETRRRLALSFAMAGNRAEFEKILYPLVAKQDFASYRTRAFGLAILGEEAEAIAITEAVMPRNLSAQIAPYLRYMPRLTKAQQAAAANLGIFPRAAQIGRDAPQIAQYAGSASAGQNADARLAPQGEPLGRRDDAASPRRRPDRGRSAVEDAPVVALVTPKSQAAVSTIIPSNSAQTQEPVPAPTTSAPSPTETSPVSRQASRNALAAASDPFTRAKAPQRIRVAKSEAPGVEQPANAGSLPEQTAMASDTPIPVQKGEGAPASINAPGFDLARVGQGVTPTVQDNAKVTAVPVAAKPAPAQEAATVADAFASFTLEPTTGPAVKPGGVDILSIEPPREVAPKPEPKAAAAPKPPANPKRYWVQIATGRDRSALKFDWRRISRKAPDVLGAKSSFVATWGQTNRLLAGPYGTSREAQSAVAELKAKEVDSFTFTSAEGEEVEPLK